MDNTNSITESSSPSITESSSGGFLEGLKQVDMSTWVIIFLIFTFLGFNIFIYLAKGTDYLAKVTENISNAIKPISGAFVSLFGDVTKDAVGVAIVGTHAAVSGTQKIVNVGADEINKSLDSIMQKGGATPSPTPTPSSSPSPSSATSSVKGQSVTKTDTAQTIALNNALNASASKQSPPPTYEADDSNSKIQTGGNKSGWCYIGEDRGFRSCISVGEGDTCMSGDIFPSQELCINPNLR